MFRPALARISLELLKGYQQRVELLRRDRLYRAITLELGTLTPRVMLRRPDPMAFVAN